MILVILLTICFFSFISRNDNPLLGFRISIFVLFFLAAFQYDCSIDYWVPYKVYWFKVANGLPLDCEFIYKYLIYACIPLGFFGFSIIVQLINYSVYYYLIKKNCPEKYLWLSIVLFSLMAKHFLLFANSYRQTLAVTFTMLALDTLLSSHMWWHKYVREERRCLVSYISAFVYIIIAANIHNTAYICMLFLLLPFFLKFRLVDNFKFNLVLFFTLYIGRSFVSLTNIAFYMQTFLSDKENRFQYYMYQIQDNSVEQTFYLQMLYVVSIIIMSFKMHALNSYQKSLAFAIIIGITLQPFLWTDAERLMMFFTIYWIILIPVLVSQINNRHVKIVFTMLWVMYSVVNILKNIGSMNYHKWLDNFQFIFEAPIWL